MASAALKVTATKHRNIKEYHIFSDITNKIEENS